jgi:hypothetical protein
MQCNTLIIANMQHAICDDNTVENTWSNRENWTSCEKIAVSYRANFYT